MTQSTIKESVDVYVSQGVNCVPGVKGKALMIKDGTEYSWKRFQKEHYRGEITGDYAVILGSVSHNLICLDFDECDDIREIETDVLTDVLNRTLVVRTGDGYHVYLKLKGEMLRKSNVFLKKGRYSMEIKGNGAYVIGMGSDHYDRDENNRYTKTGKKYNRISNTTKIAELKADGETILKALINNGWDMTQSVSDGDINNPQSGVATNDLVKGSWSSGSRYMNGFKLALRRFHNLGIYSTILDREVENREDILEEAIKINQSCSPPHSQNEVERWVNDAYNQYIKNKEDPESPYFRDGGDTGSDGHSSKQKEKGPSVDQVVDKIMDAFWFRTASDNEQMFWFDGKVYDPIGAETKIKAACEFAKEGCSNRFVTEVIGKIKRKSYVDRNRFDADVDILTLENGILNMKTMELSPHSRDNLSTILIPVTLNGKPRKLTTDLTVDQLYTELNDTSFFKYLKSCFTEGNTTDDTSIYTVLEMMASCLLKTNKFHKAVMMIGSGQNGKSVCLNYLTHLLGPKNVSDVPIQTLAHERFGVAELYCKLANIFADIESTELRATGKIKVLVSDDAIYAERKNRDPFYFNNYAKLIFSANRFPQVQDQSDGFFRRFIIINWSRQFTSEERDSDLLSKLIAKDEEVSFIFSFLVTLANRLSKRGRFLYESSTSALRREWTKHSDPIQMFIDQMIEDESSDEVVPKLIAYRRYKEFCMLNEMQPDKMKAFSSTMAQYYEEGVRKINDVSTRVWLGIKIKDLFTQETLG